MDSELLGQLLDRHAAALELYARQWCDSPEDIVQDAFLKLATLRTLPRDPAAWLFRVVRNAAINVSVAARRRTRRESAAAVGVPPWFEPDSTAERGEIDPEAAAAELRVLPIAEREVIVARIWGGLTFAQTAELAGCSTSTAHRLYESGLATLRERLGVPCRKNPSRPIPS